MKPLFVVYFIFASLFSALSQAAEPIAEPKGKAIEEKTLEKGAEENWAVESIYRSQYLYPSNWGQAGIFRVRSAESLPPGTLTFGIGGEFYSLSNGPDFGTGGSAKTIAENLFIGFSPAKRVTLSIMRRSSSTTFGDPAQLISSLGDFNFSGMYSFPLNSSMVLAPIANILVASNFNNLAPAGSTLSAGLGAAFSFSLFPTIGIPLFTHANLIYHMPQIRNTAPLFISQETYFNFSRFDTLTFALGAEYKLGDFIPFVEFQDVIQAGSGLSLGSQPSKISVGSRFTPLSNKSLALLLGADIGIGRGTTVGVPYSPSYQILGQISYTVSLFQTERKHYLTTADVNVIDRKFSIEKNIKFMVGSTEIENESKGLLDQIAEIIEQNKIKRLLIVGHTDSTHTEDYNLKLSLDRANTVKKYLISKGTPEEVLIAQGYGKRKPKASNLSEEGRSINRRVEFYILE